MASFKFEVPSHAQGSAQASQTPQDLLFGVYRRGAHEPERSNFSDLYAAFVGERRGFAPVIDGTRYYDPLENAAKGATPPLVLVDAMPIIPEWRKGIEEFLLTEGETGTHLPIHRTGQIVVWVSGQGKERTVKTTIYTPKNNFNRKGPGGNSILGFSYGVEGIMVSEMLGTVAKVTTSENASDARKKQVRRVGLEYATPFAAETWVERMSLGIKISVEKLREMARGNHTQL